eukprot:scaffold5221_cov397-Prasinococcus_capsulatus_cf.AAC.12
MEALLMAMFGIGNGASSGLKHELDERGGRSKHTTYEVSHHEGCQYVGSLMVKRVPGTVCWRRRPFTHCSAVQSVAQGLMRHAHADAVFAREVVQRGTADAT